jgi:SAM-dependent methyltransferase
MGFDILQRVIRRLRGEGLWRAAAHAYDRLVESYHERRLGIHTTGRIGRAELGVRDERCHDYSPTDYRSFARMMKHTTIRAGEDCFLDYGSGLGRVVIMAAQYPFRRVIGVELAPSLTAAAQDNLRKAQGKLKCRDVQLVTCDATAYVLPPEVTHIHLYSPFSGEILQAVMGNIRRSLEEHPRSLTILFKNTTYLTELEARVGKYDWLTQRHAIMLRHPYVIFEACIFQPAVTSAPG